MFDGFDINLVRGVLLILLIFAFAGIWAWAWSRKRKPEFDAASKLPLEEDDGTVPQHDADEDNEERRTAENRLDR